MAYSPVLNPFETFFDTNGDPLEDGYIYIGTENLNPETNPITVYWDKGITPAAQPIRTKSGYPVRDGSPGEINATGNYSITVRDKNGNLVYSAPSRTIITNPAYKVGSIAALRLSSGYADGDVMLVASYYAGGTTGGGPFVWDATSTATDNGGTIIQVTGVATGRWIARDLANYRLSQFGAKLDGSTDDSARVQAAFDAVPDSGARVIKDPGILVINNQVKITKGGTVFESDARGGKMQGGLGSYITHTANITGDILRVEGAANIAGVALKNLAFFGDNSRTYSVNSALHIENCDSLVVENLQVQSIKGQAVKAVRAVKSTWKDVDIIFCGDTGKPAFELAGTSSADAVQNSTFTGLKIEFCQSNPYMKIGPYDRANKFFGLGFEGSVPGATYDFPYLEAAGYSNTFVGVSLGQLGLSATVQKVKVSGHHNIFDGVTVIGDRYDADSYDFYVTGAHTLIGDVTIAGLATTTDTYFAKLATGSDYSTISKVTSDKSGGILVDSLYSTVKDATFVSLNTPYGVSVSSTCRDVTVENVKFFNQGTAVVANILDDGVYSNIEHNRVDGTSASTHTGILGTGSQGAYNNNYLRGCGGHAMHFPDGYPRSIDDNTIIDPGTYAVSTYMGIFLDLSAGADTVGGTLVGNTQTSPVSTPLYGIAIDDVTGTARHQYWTITGNRAEDGIRNGNGSVSAYNNIVANNT